MKDNIFKISDISKILSKRCTGCGACKAVCPVQAIFMEADNEGFWHPQINRDLCIHCGRCSEVCPVYDHNVTLVNKNSEEYNIYAAWSLNPQIRYESTSGGIFSELAGTFMREGGVICGAVYDKQNMVCHIVSDKIEDIERLRQSKYVQSDMGDVYREIAKKLKQGRKVLFCGTPCQCAGIYRYCFMNHIDSDRLWLVDFICRGSNSPKVYRKFLDELEEKYQSHIIRVWFKNKYYGWNRFSTKIELENGACYLEDRYHDVYIRGYIEENLYIRPSCSECRFKGFYRTADISLADFWGIKLQDSDQDTDGGTSMVMIHTKKGQLLWNAISDAVYKVEKSLKDVTNGNECFFSSAQPGKHREEFMRDLDRMPVIDNISRFLKDN